MRTNKEFISSLLKKYSLGGEVKENKSTASLGDLVLKLLWIRSQATVFHWQTDSGSVHESLNRFMGDYSWQLDKLVESILSKSDRNFSVEQGSIKLVNYSKENLDKYLVDITEVFTKEVPKHFKDTLENSGLYHTLGDILEIISTLKYLLKQK